jgi:thioredoxin-related protein
MKNIHSTIQTVSNVAIIIVALLFSAVLVKRYLFPSASPQPSAVVSENIKAGTKLPLTDVDWSKSEKTLLMVLSTTCRYCTESSGFYQKLAQQKAGRGDMRLVAVMPQTVEEAQQYLSEHKVSVDEVRQASLDTINIRGTPTLIVVDKTGAVVQSWVGKLPPEKESEVVAHFFGERSGL